MALLIFTALPTGRADTERAVHASGCMDGTCRPTTSSKIIRQSVHTRQKNRQWQRFENERAGESLRVKSLRGFVSTDEHTALTTGCKRGLFKSPDHTNLRTLCCLTLVGVARVCRWFVRVTKTYRQTNIPSVSQLDRPTDVRTASGSGNISSMDYYYDYWITRGLLC